MYRKLCFLSFFVLVLALSGTAQGWKSIDDPNYNLSFEYDSNGDQMYCSTRVSCKSEWDPNYVSQCGVMSWLENDVDWPVVEQECSQSAGPSDDCQCKEGVFATDGICDLTMGQFGATIDANMLVWQSLDPNYDANVIIQPYHEYRVSYDTFKWGSPTLKVYLFYGYIPDNNLLDPNVNTIVQDEPSVGTDPEDWKTCSVGFLSEVGQPYIGERLGIRFFQTGEGWYWIDNVKVEYKNLAAAHDPTPEDEATEVPKDANLGWNPGLWASGVNGHEVYFGSTFSEVDNATTGSAEFKGIQSPSSFDPTPGANVLTLGDTYYWRIDEVNETYSPGPNEPPIPPNYRWKGEVWSFTVAGRAKNPRPEDGATDVPRNVILRWTRGAESLYHDVYFGTSEADVNSATTGSGEYATQLNKGTEQYDAGTEENPSVGEQCFWRIDEVNLITVKGNTWDFTVANYILVDDFDFYADHQAQRDVWHDWLSGHTGDAEVYVNKDANFSVDGNSMRLDYWNGTGPYYSEAMRSYSSGQDWSYSGGGVTLLEIDWFGDVNSEPAPPMYVKLSDGSTTAQVNPGPNDVTDESQHTWNIPLSDFSGVTLSSITAITLGIGDAKAPGDGDGTLYFDDIRLHPPRCMMEYTSVADFTGDCFVDNNDLYIIATDWLMTDGDTLTETRNANLINFTNDPCQWITGHIGSGALEFDGVDDYVEVTDPRLVGLTSMSITAWVSQTIDNEWVSIVRSKEPTCGDDQVELGLYGAEYGGGGGLGYDWSCGTEEWEYDADLDVPIDGTWTFVAVTVEPNSATLYMRPDGCDLDWGTNAVAHEPVDSFAVSFQIGDNAFNGEMDDVRIYAYHLTFADINDLAYQAAEPNPAPVYWYKFDETAGLVAADSGTPTLVYGPVQSKANLTDPEAKLSRSLNFRDYAIFAEDWLGEFKYPYP